MTVTTTPPGATVTRATRLSGELRLPGDKSISHRALMLALLANGDVPDHWRRRRRGRALDRRDRRGARWPGDADRDGGPGNVDYVVASGGAGGLRDPQRPLDCGNSGTSMRLFAGILAGEGMDAILDGDASLRRRPMARIVQPLRAMGAWLEGMAGERPPLIVSARTRLRAIKWETPVPSAQVKSSILLAGLSAEGTTRVRESVATRDHTERMLRARGVHVRSRCDARRRRRHRGRWRFHGGGARRGRARRPVRRGLLAGRGRRSIPTRSSVLNGVGVNPTRRADRRRPAAHGSVSCGGATASEGTEGDAGEGGAGEGGAGEPIADLRVRSSELQAVELEPAETAGAIDEIPCCASRPRRRAAGRSSGARASCGTRNRTGSPGSLPDLRALGARIKAVGDDIVIEGPTALRGAAVDSLGDHRLALTFAIAGLVAEGATTILDADCVVDLLPDLLRRPRKDPIMSKRVVLIGHPVAHSLSGAMQQAAFDAAGIDAQYELWDQRADRAPDAIAEVRGDDFLGANVTIPHKERVVPMIDKLTEEAQATGAVNTLTREGRRLVGHNTDVPGFNVALDKLVGRQKMPRQAVVLGRRRRRARGGLRADPGRLPAGHRVQPPPAPGRGPRQALRPKRVAHGPQGDALARVDHRVRAGEDEGPHQRDLDRPEQR